MANEATLRNDTKLVKAIAVVAMGGLALWMLSYFVKQGGLKWDRPWMRPEPNPGSSNETPPAP